MEYDNITIVYEKCPAYLSTKNEKLFFELCRREKKSPM